MTGRSRRFHPFKETDGHGWKPSERTALKRAPVSFRADNVGADGCTVIAFEQIRRVEPRPRLCMGRSLFYFQEEY